MRDLDRWKDKVELSLDGRQIFFIFFGSSIIACMIFVFGIMLGKRLEARALALSPPQAEDPLAALDQLSDADDGLTFHHALTTPRKNVPAAAALVDTAETVKKKITAENKVNSGNEPDPINIKNTQEAPLAHLPTLPNAVAAPKPETGHFTLQLSAFPDKSDAEEFMHRVRPPATTPSSWRAKSPVAERSIACAWATSPPAKPPPTSKPNSKRSSA